MVGTMFCRDYGDAAVSPQGTLASLLALTCPFLRTPVLAK